MSAFWNWLIGREQAVVTAVTKEVTIVETKAVEIAKTTFAELVAAVETKIAEFEKLAEQRLTEAYDWAKQASHLNEIEALARDEATKAAAVASSLKELFSNTAPAAPVAPAVVEATPVAPVIQTTPAPLQAGQPLA